MSIENNKYKSAIIRNMEYTDDVAKECVVSNIINWIISRLNGLVCINIDDEMLKAVEKYARNVCIIDNSYIIAIGIIKIIESNNEK